MLRATVFLIIAALAMIAFATSERWYEQTHLQAQDILVQADYSQCVMIHPQEPLVPPRGTEIEGAPRKTDIS